MIVSALLIRLPPLMTPLLLRFAIPTHSCPAVVVDAGAGVAV